MAETWLRVNTRVLVAGTIPVVLLGLMGGVLATGLIPVIDRPWLRVGGWVVVAVAALVIAALLRQMARPRLACDGTHLIVDFGAIRPFRVPLEAVEVFFQGQGPAMLKGWNEKAKAANIGVRLAERAEDWHARDVKPVLGAWCEGYITIRGTWCEPIHPEVIHRLNRRLREAKGDLGFGIWDWGLRIEDRGWVLSTQYSVLSTQYWSTQ